MRPTRALVALLVVWGLGGIAASAWPPALSPWNLFGAALILASVLDLAALLRRPTPDVTRRMAEAWPIGVERTVTLRIEGGPRVQHLEVFDLHPPGWRSAGLPRRVHLAPDTLARVAYTLQPDVRGAARFERVQLRLRSPFGLWQQRREAGTSREVRVFPNFAPLTRLALVGADRASRLVGAHIRRRRGEGTDFHQMREYRVGDSLRQIDWKASSRARKLVSREYQDEKNQQLVVVLDTGRRMLAQDGALSHFDHALDAALVVSYLALRQGDAVGLFATGGESRWMAPQRGMGAIDTLLRVSHDLQPRAVATDYLAAATELSLRQRRRGLLMLVTNLRDEDIEDVLAAVRLLQTRHLVVVASLRERALDDALAGEVHDHDDAVRAGATARYLAQRRAAHDALRHHRIAVLDVTGDALPSALVDHYLAVKRDGML